MLDPDPKVNFNLIGVARMGFIFFQDTGDHSFRCSLIDYLLKIHGRVRNTF